MKPSHFVVGIALLAVVSPNTIIKLYDAVSTSVYAIKDHVSK